MKSFIHEGKQVTVVATGGDYASGAVVEIGDRVAVVEGDIAENDSGPALVDGVVELAQDAVAKSVGEKVYWNNGSSVITKTASTNKPAGWVAESSASGDAKVKVLLGAW